MARRIARFVAAAALALLAAAPALALFGRDRPGIALACALAFGIGATVALGAARLRLPVEVTAVVLVPFAAAWGFGEGLGFFAGVRGWDALCHLLAGHALGVVAGGAAAARGASVARALGLALAAALAVGILWELGEGASDAILGTRTLGTPVDTRTDLVLDGAGGLLGGAAILAGRRWLPPAHRRRIVDGLGRISLRRPREA